jgi:hypothetical protein
MNTRDDELHSLRLEVDSERRRCDQLARELKELRENMASTFNDERFPPELRADMVERFFISTRPSSQRTKATVSAVAEDITTQLRRSVDTEGFMAPWRDLESFARCLVMGRVKQFIESAITRFLPDLTKAHDND